MPFQVIPKEHAFFDLFQQAAANVVEAAKELAALTEDLSDGESKAGRIKTLEHEGDELTHRILALLNTTFVTPFDRADIYRLASRLDDVLDAAEAVSDLLVLHRIEDPLPRPAERTVPERDDPDRAVAGPFQPVLGTQLTVLATADADQVSVGHATREPR